MAGSLGQIFLREEGGRRTFRLDVVINSAPSACLSALPRHPSTHSHCLIYNIRPDKSRTRILAHAKLTYCAGDHGSARSAESRKHTEERSLPSPALRFHRVKQSSACSLSYTWAALNRPMNGRSVCTRVRAEYSQVCAGEKQQPHKPPMARLR